MRDYREIWVAKWLHRVEHTHTRTYTHTQARRRRSVRVNALVQGDRKLSPLPSSLPLSVSFCHGRVRTADFHATISAFRCAAIIGRCERKLVSLGQSFRGGGWWVVVVVVVVVVEVEVASHNHQSQSFGEKAAGYLTSCYTPPPRVYDPLTAIMQPNLSLPLYNRVSRDVRLFRWEDLSLSLWMMQRNGLREISPVWNSYLFLSRQKEENLLYSMESISNSNKEIT